MARAKTTAKSDQTSKPSLYRPSWWQSPMMLFLVAIISLFVLIGTEAFVALAVVLMESAIALGVVCAAGLAGGWLIPLIGLRQVSLRDRLVLGGCLGIGLLPLLILGLGSLGILGRGVAALLALLIGIAGLLRFAIDLVHAIKQQEAALRASSSQLDTQAESTNPPPLQPILITPAHWLWLVAIPFLAIALLAAALPPGVIWAEEGFGYDVLEYHLAVPKAFMEAGQIFFMPYNVYSNFPLNSEMWSLFIMLLRGDAVEGSFMAQAANVGLGALFVIAAWWAGRSFSPKAGILAGITAATAPWVAYLSGIAYVEPGMLAMGMGALGACLHARHYPEQSNRWYLATGLLAGLACGFKYPALPLIALPLLILIGAAPLSRSLRLQGSGCFLLCLLVTFSPWLIRNFWNTGNPVFPLAYSIFGADPGVWDAESNERWQAAHGWEDAAASSERSMPLLALQRSIGDIRMGPLILLLAIIGIIRRRDRWTLSLVILLAVQLIIWFTATHLFARFAVVLLLPLAVLAGRAVESLQRKWARGLIYILVVLGAGINLYPLMLLYYDHTRYNNGRPILAFGHTDWFAKGQWPGTEYLAVVNMLASDMPDSKVLLVGEARTFYLETPHEYAVVFNHHPLARITRRHENPEAILEALSDRGITHLLVHWGELRRLQQTYGLEPRLDPQLFTELEQAGLRQMGSFFPEQGQLPYATLYEVPNE